VDEEGEPPHAETGTTQRWSEHSQLRTKYITLVGNAYTCGNQLQILTRYLNLASEDAIQAHQTNSPTDRFYSKQQAGGR
jgi:hypothetical protein